MALGLACTSHVRNGCHLRNVRCRSRVRSNSLPGDWLRAGRVGLRPSRVHHPRAPRHHVVRTRHKVNNLRLAPRPPPRRAEAFAEQSTDLLMRSLFCGYLSDSNFTEIFSGPNNALIPIQRAVSAVGWKLGIAAEVRSLANPLIRHCDPSEWFGGCHRARGAPPWSLRTLRWFEVSLRRSWLPPSSGSTRWGHRP